MSSDGMIDLATTPPAPVKAVEESAPVGAGTGGDSFRLSAEEVPEPIASKEDIVESAPGVKMGSGSKGGQFGSALTSLRKSLTLRRPLSKHHKAGRVASAERARSFEDEPPQPSSGRPIDESSMESISADQAQPSSGFTRNMTSAFHAVWRTGAKSKSATKHNTEVESLTKSIATPTMATPAGKPAIREQPPNKFFIENYVDTGDKIIEFGDQHDVSMRHAVMITNCSNCTIKLTKKVNKLEVAQCKKVNVMFPAVIASVDVQKSQSCKLTAMQNLPGMALDTVESLQVYVPRACKDNLEITSSGSGSASLFIPKAEDSSDFEEYQIPFQFTHKIVNDKLVSTVSALYTS